MTECSENLPEIVFIQAPQDKKRDRAGGSAFKRGRSVWNTVLNRQADNAAALTCNQRGVRLLRRRQANTVIKVDDPDSSGREPQIGSGRDKMRKYVANRPCQKIRFR